MSCTSHTAPWTHWKSGEKRVSSAQYEVIKISFGINELSRAQLQSVALLLKEQKQHVAIKCHFRRTESFTVYTIYPKFLRYLYLQWDDRRVCQTEKIQPLCIHTHFNLKYPYSFASTLNRHGGGGGAWTPTSKGKASDTQLGTWNKRRKIWGEWCTCPCPHPRPCTSTHTYTLLAHRHAPMVNTP